MNSATKCVKCYQTKPFTGSSTANELRQVSLSWPQPRAVILRNVDKTLDKFSIWMRLSADFPLWRTFDVLLFTFSSHLMVCQQFELTKVTTSISTVTGGCFAQRKLSSDHNCLIFGNEDYTGHRPHANKTSGSCSLGNNILKKGLHQKHVSCLSSLYLSVHLDILSVPLICFLFQLISLWKRRFLLESKHQVLYFCLYLFQMYKQKVHEWVPSRCI